MTTPRNTRRIAARFSRKAKNLLDPDKIIADWRKRLDDIALGDDLALFRLISKLHGSELAQIPTNIRYDLIEKLGTRPSFARQEQLDRRDFVATLLLATQPYPDIYQLVEDTWVKNLFSTPLFQNLKSAYDENPNRQLSARRFIALAQEIGAAQA
ncbi:MAG TPA: hypothetical protein VIN59_06935, partial [Alphaproteobacteria bacterium]